MVYCAPTSKLYYIQLQTAINLKDGWVTTPPRCSQKTVQIDVELTRPNIISLDNFLSFFLTFIWVSSQKNIHVI